MNYNPQSPAGSVELDQKIGISYATTLAHTELSTIQVLLTGGT